MSKEKSGGGISLATKLRYETPENFFPIAVDDFFNDPEMIVDYGKSLPKKNIDRQPGRSSGSLWEIDNILSRAIMMKILSCYYDLDYIDISWQESEMSFREIPRFSENKNDIRNKGWIHQDDNDHAQLAGLIYLTPNIDPDSGTSLYSVKSNKYKKEKQVLKNELYKSGHFDREEYTKSYINHEKALFEKVRFQNSFNRLIMYDTGEWHRANSFYNGDGEDARLTLAFFVGNVYEDVPSHELMSISPLKRTKNSEFESVIKLQIEKK